MLFHVYQVFFVKILLSNPIYNSYKGYGHKEPVVNVMLSQLL